MSAKALLSASVSAPPAVYVEEVFSTFLYTGTGAALTITNGIDLSGKGGLTWIKKRSGANGHRFTDTARGATKSLASDSSAAEATETTGLTSFSSTGFAIGTDLDYNQNTDTFCSWTFRKAAKFFDVVTWTGDGTSSRNISHSLGSTPGFIIVKRTSVTADWYCWHRSISTGNLSGNDLIVLNSTAAKTNIGTVIGTASSATFEVGYDSVVNVSGSTYVAYLFAHNAGGFGTAGTDNVVSCGSYTGTGTTKQIDCGFTAGARFVLIKRTDSTGDWYVWDTARGIISGNDPFLLINSTAAENTSTDYIDPLSSGFEISSTAPAAINANGGTYIFLAIA